MVLNALSEGSGAKHGEMADKHPSNWKWWLLVTGLAAAHFVVLMFVIFSFTVGVYSGPRRPHYQPPWLYHAFINVFGFPGILITRIARLGPNDGTVGWSLIAVTCLLWGCVWAEPFRRRCGWQPWRFSIRELLLVTTIVAAILGLFVLLK
jgi:hypothetical protein